MPGGAGLAVSNPVFYGCVKLQGCMKQVHDLPDISQQCTEVQHIYLGSEWKEMRCSALCLGSGEGWAHDPGWRGTEGTWPAQYFYSHIFED